MIPRTRVRMGWGTAAMILAAALPAAMAAAAAAPNPLDIYYIDVEGGQATLFVAPSGESVLVDTGFPGTRDPGRIMDAVHAAGLKQLDYVLITHYHGDHVGGYKELAARIPIMHLVDHGPTVQPEQNIDSKQQWDADIRTKPHIVAQAGARLPVKGLDWTFVSAAGKTLVAPMKDAPGAGRPNPYCADYKPKEISVDMENAQSIGSVIAYGKFRTVDLGDLLWNWEAKLACPVNEIGTVDLFLTTHHGMSWSGVPALVYALHPRVAVMNTGTRKGGQVETFEMLESSPGLENIWQLHWAVNGGLEHNVPAVYIANIETAALTASLIANPPPPPVMGTRPPDIGNPDHAPAWWIKVSALPDGTFTVTNARNGFSKTYRHR